MPVEIAALDSEGMSEGVRIDNTPRTCPHCNYGVEPKIHFAYLRDDNDKLEVITPCPRVECGRLTVSIYDRVGAQTYRFMRSEGRYHPHTKFPDEINEISSKFQTIYSHAEEAENQGLDEICGPGYRKALEFLVKDYAIAQSPEEKEKIATNYKLGAVIHDYISDAKVQQLAKRAAWLGNDETHYKKRWGMGLAELKDLIQLVVNAIENERIAMKYIKDMPEEGPKSAEDATEEKPT